MSNLYKQSVKSIQIPWNSNSLRKKIQQFVKVQVIYICLFIGFFAQHRNKFPLQYNIYHGT